MKRNRKYKHKWLLPILSSKDRKYSQAFQWWHLSHLTRTFLPQMCRFTRQPVLTLNITQKPLYSALKPTVLYPCTNDIIRIRRETTEIHRRCTFRIELVINTRTKWQLTNQSSQLVRLLHYCKHLLSQMSHFTNLYVRSLKYYKECIYWRNRLH